MRFFYEYCSGAINVAGMFKRIIFVFTYWFGWLLFFEAARIAFLIANASNVEHAGLSTVLPSLWYGLRMDASMAAYLSIPVLVAVIFSIFIGWFGKPIFYKIYSAFILLVIMLLLFADIGLFKAWGFRLDDTVLKYMSSPREVWASVSHLPVFFIIAGFIILFTLLIFLSNKLLGKINLPAMPLRQRFINLSLLLVLAGIMIIPLRGGLQLAPLNQSSVYFSNDNFANMVAINAPWNFMHAVTHHVDKNHNPFAFEDIANANATVDSILVQSGKTMQVIDTGKLPKPNVLFIVWESFTAKALGLQVDGKMITPGINKLVNEGVYFSNIYASGDRTDKGIVAILSGYPSQPTTSIVKEPGKAAKLPSLGKYFIQQGYNSSFYYGGELAFANMKAYLLQGGFNKFVSIDDFEKKDQNSKWGAHDGIVMKRLQKDLQQSKQPFFTTWLTLSSHEPYEIPAKPLLAYNTDEAKFLSSLHYTDSVVYEFLMHAQQQAWWSNTIVVITGDHGHRLPVAVDKAADFHIPLLFLGGALDTAGIRVNKIGSQTGIAATLLAQLGNNPSAFPWSQNLLDSSTLPWALYNFNNGFGLVQPGGRFVYDNVGNRLVEQQGQVNPADLRVGRAVQQVYFQDYLDK